MLKSTVPSEKRRRNLNEIRGVDTFHLVDAARPGQNLLQIDRFVLLYANKRRILLKRGRLWIPESISENLGVLGRLKPRRNNLIINS